MIVCWVVGVLIVIVIPVWPVSVIDAVDIIVALLSTSFAISFTITIVAFALPLLWAISDKVALLAAVVAWSFTAFAAIALSFPLLVPGFWAIPDLVIRGSAIKTCAALTAFAKRVELFLAVVGLVVNFATAGSTGP